MTTVSNNVIHLGDRKLKFAALSFRQLEDLKGDIDLLMSPDGLMYTSAATREALMAIILASTGNAGEEVDRDFLLDHLDVANFNGIGFTLFDRNGFLAKEDAPGEATATPSPN